MSLLDEKPEKSIDYSIGFLILALAIGFTVETVKTRNPLKALGFMIVAGAFITLIYLLSRKFAPNSWLLWFFVGTAIWFFIFFVG